MTHRALTSLPTALLANACLSAVTGVLLLALAGPVAGLFIADVTTLLRGFGAVLLLHTVILLAVRRRASWQFWTRLNLICIAPYPVALLAVILAGWTTGPAGIALVTADADAVAVMTLWQAITLQATA